VEQEVSVAPLVLNDDNVMKSLGEPEQPARSQQMRI
jgi:hypothetical protein